MNKSKKNNLNKPAAITVLVISILLSLCLLGLLGSPGMAVTSFFVGTFGFAVYAYAMSAIMIAVSVIMGFRVSVSLKNAMRYAGIIFFIVFADFYNIY